MPPERIPLGSWNRGPPTSILSPKSRAGLQWWQVLGLSTIPCLGLMRCKRPGGKGFLRCPFPLASWWGSAPPWYENL
jgi:hypothetical protein